MDACKRREHANLRRLRVWSAVNDRAKQVHIDKLVKRADQNSKTRINWRRIAPAWARLLFLVFWVINHHIECLIKCNRDFAKLPSHFSAIFLQFWRFTTLTWYGCKINGHYAQSTFSGNIQVNVLILCTVVSARIYSAPPPSCDLYYFPQNRKTDRRPLDRQVPTPVSTSDNKDKSHSFVTRYRSLTTVKQSLRNQYRCKNNLTLVFRPRNTELSSRNL